jgi:peptidoglycan/xylan/chitin deacetylase (PgdA/CDA1 family)
MRATLTYHSIDDSGSPISVSAAAFEDHLRWLTSGRARVLPLTELATEPHAAGDAVAVTFDDGFSNARWAVERLLDHGITPTIFVVTGHVGGTNAWGGRDQPGIPTLPLMAWSDLEHLVSRGAHAEAHSRTHPALTGMSRVQLDDELKGSQHDLRERLGVTSAHVAYPYGDVDDVVAARAGDFFTFGHTTEFNFIPDTCERTRLPRLDMYYFRSSKLLERWGTAGFRSRMTWIRARRRIRAFATR